jgi:hypothetical protein
MDSEQHRAPYQIPVGIAGYQSGCQFCGADDFQIPGPCLACLVFCADDQRRPPKAKRKGREELEENLLDLLQVDEDQENKLIMTML